MRDSVVNLLLAFCDLYHGLVEHTAPKYASYKFAFKDKRAASEVAHAVAEIEPKAVGTLSAATSSPKPVGLTLTSTLSAGTRLESPAPKSPSFYPTSAPINGC